MVEVFVDCSKWDMNECNCVIVVFDVNGWWC